MVELKTCRDCGSKKEATPENFIFQLGKITKWCRDCKRAYQSKYNKTPNGKLSQKKYYQTPNGIQKSKEGVTRYNTKYKGIYGIFDINDKCLYIGASGQFNGRVVAHRHAINNLEMAEKHRKSMYPLYVELAKYETVKFKLLEECPKSELKHREEYYISQYNPIYNIYKK